jgi:phosphatidylglycerophosphatase A
VTRLAVFISTFAYIGFFPAAPGTVGSAAGLAVYGLIELTTGTSVAPAQAIAIVITTVLGVWAAGRAERHFGGTDPGPIVIDEVAGMLVTLALVPVGTAGMFVGFVLFRIFDVIKPFPAGRFERLPGGWGVMCDDLMAGVYANLALRVTVWAAPAWTS